MSRRSINQKKIVTIYVSDKEFISTICKELLNSIIKFLKKLKIKKISKGNG